MIIRVYEYIYVNYVSVLVMGVDVGSILMPDLFLCVTEMLNDAKYDLAKLCHDTSQLWILLMICEITRQITAMKCCKLIEEGAARIVWQKLCPVSIQTQSLPLHALRKRKPEETQVLALASSQSWLPLLRPSIPIGWRLRLLREIFTQQTQCVEWDVKID